MGLTVWNVIDCVFKIRSQKMDAFVQFHDITTPFGLKFDQVVLFVSRSSIKIA